MFRIILPLIIMAMPLSVEAGGNLVKNGNFTKKLEHWKVEFPETNESKYNDNHRYVKLVAAPRSRGKCVEFTLTAPVAASQGVKAITDFIPICQGVTYEYGAEIFRDGPQVKIFIEGYEKDPEQTEAGNDCYLGFSRVYRAPIHVKTNNRAWHTVSRRFEPPKQFRPSHVIIKLYAYHPAGKVYFRDVFLRKARQ